MMKRIKCPVCGKKFEPHRAGTLYCSAKCSKAAANRRQNEKHKAARAAARGTRTCPTCGKVFTPKSSLAVFCSRRCRNGSRPKVQREPSPPPREDASLEKVRAYLALPAAERYARREELSYKEHRLAMRVWEKDHLGRCVSVNLQL